MINSARPSLTSLPRRRARRHAEKEYALADEAMEAYYIATGGDRTKVAAIPVLGPEPVLGDFYILLTQLKKLS